MPIKRVPPPPSTHTPYRIVVSLSDGRGLRITRTPQGLIQLRMMVNGITFPGPEFPDTDLALVLAGLERMGLKIANNGE